MTPSQKLRSIADSTGLDGIADAIREIANEIEHNNAPAQPAHEQEQMKADRDLILFGTGVMRDGKHVPLEQVRFEPATPAPAPAFNGWYCAHCQRGVDGSEVTYHEQHTVCGRVITDDVPPAPAPSGFAKALDIRISQGWKLTGNTIPVLYTDTINGDQVMRDDVWLCTTSALEVEAPAPAQEPYTTIDLGHGKFEVGAGKNGGLPCIAFGRNGTGKVGEPITAEPRQMSVEETFAVITFANVTGLDVLQEKMDQVREEFFPGTTPQFVATQSTAPAQEVATLSLSAEDVHAAFTKNFPKSRISQAWINFAADIAQAIATRAAKPAQDVGLTDEQKTWAVNQLMEQAQVFASAWSLVGGRHDFGNALEEAEQAKTELRSMVVEALHAKGGK